MKTILIIPDLHLRWQHADKIINKVGITDEDEVIFLGDFFDDFDDTHEMVEEMCDWLESSVKKHNHIHIFGNHDLHYAFASNWFHCSGYDQWKYFLIHDRFQGTKVWEKFKYYHILDGKFLITHAGLHKHWLPENIRKLYKNRPVFLKEISDYLDNEIIKGHRNESWIFHAGHARYGFQRVGGITWCDYEQEFNPIKGLNQIFGHTPQQLNPRWCCLNGRSKLSYHPLTGITPELSDYDNVIHSYNLCLDVRRNTHWAVWNGLNLTFGNYIDDL